MDEDLDGMNEAELRDVAKAMRAAIREHRDSSGHDLCWHHPDLWNLLPDTATGTPEVPEWPQFMRGCVAYRASLDVELAAASRTDREFGDDGLS